MLSLAWNTLRTRRAAFAGAFVALLCASALISACGVLLETGLRGGTPPERYAGAPLLVGADQQLHVTKHRHGKEKTKSVPLAERAWLPDDLVGRLGAVPGVDRVVPEVTFPAQTRRGVAQGHAWDSAPLTPFTLARGHPPRGDDEVVADAQSGLRPGARITVSATAEPRTYTVAGVTAQALPRQESLFFSRAEAARLAARPGQVSAIGVFPASAGRAVRDALRGTAGIVYTGQSRGSLEFADAAKARVMLVSMGGALGGTSLLVAILVVVGTFALSIEQRRRELALLRAVAATPRHIRAMIGSEALLVGAFAGLLGGVAGLGLSGMLRRLFVAHGVLPANLTLTRGPFPVGAALAATLLAGWAAARLSARRTARIRPAEALAEVAVERDGVRPGRTIAGLAVLAGQLALLGVLRVLDTDAAAVPVTFLSVVLGAVAVALLGPVVSRAALALLGVPLRLGRVAGHLAAANAGASPRRLALVVTPLTLAVGMTCTILFLPATAGNAARAQARDGALASSVLAGRVPHVATGTVRSLPGVRAVTEVVPTTIRAGKGRYTASGVTTAGVGRTFDPGVRSGSLDRLAGDAVAVSTAAAARLHARLGDSVGIAMGDGTPVRVRVVAVYSRGLGFGDLLLPYGAVAGHVDDPLPRQVLVAGGSTGALRAAVRAYPGVRALPAARMEGLGAGRRNDNTEVNLVVMGLLVAFTAIAVVNTLAMATAARSRELALLRLVGTTRAQLLRMLRLETLTVTVTGVALGTAIAVATLTSYAVGMTGSARPAFPVPTYLTVAAACVVLALVATAVPGRLALRTNPAEAVGARDG